MSGRNQETSAAAVLGVVLVLVVTGLVVDVVGGGTREVGPISSVAQLRAGSATCAAVGLGEGADVTATTVVAPSDDAPDEEQDPGEEQDEQDGTAAADTDTGTVALRLEEDGDVRSLATPATDGGAVATAVVGDGATAAIAARWADAPLVLARRWTVGDGSRVPGTVEATCPGEPAPRWTVPGVATAGGASAQLHIANPTDGPASLSVSFTTPDGPVAPTRLANLAVPPHDQVVVDLNEFVPEEPDLGVVVDARAGRVVPEVVQVLEAAVGGVDGRALVAAHPEPAAAWTIPWVSAEDGESAWVWVTNPGTQPTDVRLVLHTTTGPVVPPDSGVTLGPGETQRIDLRGALGEVGSAAVTVRSAPEAPVVASAGVLRLVEEDAVRSGFTVIAGSVASDGPQAAPSAVGSNGQERVLVVANPGDVDAVLDVQVVGRSVAAARTVRSDLRVAAGASVEVEIDEDLPLEGGFAVLLRPTEGAVAGAVVARAEEGPLDLTAVVARPFPATVEVLERSAVRDRTLLHPLRAVEPSDDGGDETDAG